MITPAFKDFYARLNPAQKSAVDTIEGAVMVVAGPGTGKTQILTLRIANILLQTQANPQNILALTFTEAASLQMRKRLVDIIGTDGFKVTITTFHSFCNDIIQNFQEDFPDLMASESITEVEQIESLEQLVQELDLEILKPANDQLLYVRSLLSAINELKKESVSIEKFHEAINIQQQQFETAPDLYHEKGKYKGEMKGKYVTLKKDIEKNKELLVVYDSYQKFLRKEKKYDFNDMLLEVAKTLLSNKELLVILQEKYQYILVDEHQDTNAAQNKIIELLAGGDVNPNLFVVGDEKQAIFRFQGASLENFLYFRKLYPQAALINLSENYRSTQSILDAAHSVILNNISANLLLPEQIRLLSQKKEQESIKVASFNDYYTEFEYVAEGIKQKFDTGEKLSEIAVIARNNRDLVEVANALERRGIPYFLNSDTDVFRDIQIQKLLTLLSAASDFGSSEKFLSAIHIDFLGIDPLDVYKIYQYSLKEQLSFIEVIADLDNDLAEKLKLKNIEPIISFYEKLKFWNKLSKNDGVENVFITVINESGFRTYVAKSPKRFEILDKILTLYEEIKSLARKNLEVNLSDFLRHLELLKKHNIAIKTEPKTIITEAVNLMTAHRSKGQEFRNVYIIQAFDTHWGNARKRGIGFNIPWDILEVTLNKENFDENEDERRLFYVAITRAKEEVIITFSKKNPEGKEQLPSQFLTEIDPQFIKEIETADFEADFLQKKDNLFDEKVNQFSKNEKEYYNQLFLEKGLSSTAFENYLQCPWKYFYENLLQFPSQKSNSLIFGTAIHKALDDYIKLSATERANEKTLVKSYTETLKKIVFTKRDFELLSKKGEKVLTDYYKNCLVNWEKKLYSEQTVKGVKIREDVILNGRLDVIEPTEKKEEVIVHDFKTGKPKSRNRISGLTAAEGGNYKRQLMFYKLLLDNYNDGKIKMIEGVIDFVESDSKGKYKSERFTFSDEEMESIKFEVLRVADEILNLSFWDQKCEEKDCEYCLLRGGQF